MCRKARPPRSLVHEDQEPSTDESCCFVTAPTGHTSLTAPIEAAAALRRDGRLDDAVMLAEEALAKARAEPLEVAFSERVQLGLMLSDLYVAVGQRDLAHSLLSAEAEFAEHIETLIRQSGSPMQVRAASTGRMRVRDRVTQLALVGRAAPEIEVADWVQGRPTSLADQLGSVVLLEFWASWCRPCLASFPVLRELHSRYADQGLTIVALTRYVLNPRSDAVAERARQREAISATIAHRGLEFGVGIAPDGRLQQQYGATGVPAFALIDRGGAVHSASSMVDKAELENTIASLLKTPG